MKNPTVSSTEEPEANPRGKHFSLLRSFVLADAITLSNAACGMASILLSMAYVEERAPWRIWTVCGLLVAALVCDVADGSVARWRRHSSGLGADLDSLADVVSFGVAPAVLAYALGMRGGWDAVALVYFVGCGISRLARFNVTADALMNDAGKVSHFEGTPIPSSLVLVGVLALAFWLGAVHESLWLGSLTLGPFELHPLVAMFILSGTAMASATLKIPKP